MKDWNELKNAFAPAPEHFTMRMQRTLEHMEELTVKRRHRITLAALVAALVLLIGVALAATVGFGVLDLVSGKNDDGTKIINDGLVEHVQPLEIVQEGSTYRITVTDALCLGKNVSVAWRLENLSGKELYISWDADMDLQMWSVMIGEGSDSTPFEFFLAPGETLDGGMNYSLQPPIHLTGGRLEVKLEFQVMEVTAERIMLPYRWRSGEEEEAYQAGLEEQIRQGKLVATEFGVEIPEKLFINHEPREQVLERLGLVKRLENFTVPFYLQMTGEMTGILPEGQPITRQMDGYKMSLTSAEMSPMEIRLAIDCVFESEERSLMLWEGKRIRSIFSIETGDSQSLGDWYGNVSEGFDDPEKLEDGSVLVHYEITVSEIWRMPDTIIIVPETIRELETGEREVVLHSEEAFTLVIPKPI